MGISTSLNGSEIAIIGLSGRFPGAKDIDEFWQNLQQGKETIAFFTDEELLAAGINSSLLNDPNYVKAQAILEDAEYFDAEFFGFNPREATITDPQHRVFLECAWSALENAGYDSQNYPGAIGVYAGSGMNTYLLNIYLNQNIIGAVDPQQLMLAGNKDFLTTRVSYKLNLEGPSYAVQTACSTSLVAVHLACQSLLNGECDMALAGGVAINADRKAGYLYTEGGILSPDGHCRAFDADAQGSVGGEGVGIVVLKRLEDALSDRDTIHAIIKGSAINNDGAFKVSYTAPRIDTQAKVIKTAQIVAEVEAETITYIETHGTATALGDPIEMAALTQAFRSSTQKTNFCAIGSVKTNVGHLDTAAGVTGLIKTVLALKHKQIPPSLHYSAPNPEIDFANSPFYVNTKLTEWQTNHLPRRAGVSSFGLGGTNAHVILEEAPVWEGDREQGRKYQLLLLSTKTASALEKATTNLTDYLQAHPDLNLADVAYTLLFGRRTFDYRRAVVCRDIADALKALQNSPPVAHKTQPRPVAFMFSGLGTHYVDMALELYQTESTFRGCVDECCELLQPVLGLDLRDVLYPNRNHQNGKQQTQTGLDLRKMLGRGGQSADVATQKLNQTVLTQPAMFVIEYALAQLWISWGIRPTAMIGYSIGEYVAATLAEVLSLTDALTLVARRAQMIDELPAGAMLAVPLSEAEIKPSLNEKISLSAINGESLCVVAGFPDAVAELEQKLSDRGLIGKRLQTSHAFHSVMMEAIAATFHNLVNQFSLKSPKIPYISNVTGTWITAEQATDSTYWVQHLCQTVRFADGVQQLSQKDHPILLEVGPGQALISFASQCLDKSLMFPSLRYSYEQQSDVAYLLNTLGRLWQAGVTVDWSSFYTDAPQQRIPLPTYPFERQRYWVDAHPTANLVLRCAPGETQNTIEELSQEAQTAPKTSITGYVRPNLDNDYVAPRTEVEQIIANIWQELLGIASVGVEDSFFELGGDSVLGIQVSARANKAGFRLTPQQLFEHQTIAKLAQVITKTQVVQAEQGVITGSVPLTPAQHQFFALNQPETHHWNQAVLLEVVKPLNLDILEQTLKQLLIHHDALRLRFTRSESGWEQVNAAPEEYVPLTYIDLSALSSTAQQSALEVAAAQIQASLNLITGPIVRFALFDMGVQQNSRLLIVIHHLGTDPGSWRILLEDLQTGYQQLSQGQLIQLPEKTTSYQQWSLRLQKYAASEQLQQQQQHWLSGRYQQVATLPLDYPDGINTVASEAQVISVALNESETQLLLQEVPGVYRMNTQEVLLTALVQAFKQWTKQNLLLINLDENGREVSTGGIDDVDISRTVGWITTTYPVLLDLDKTVTPGDALKAVKEQVRHASSNGIDYGVLRYLSPDPVVIEKFQSLPQAEVMFLYLGQLSKSLPQDSLFKWTEEALGSTASPKAIRPYLFQINAAITEGKLQLYFNYSRNIHQSQTVEKLSHNFIQTLKSLISHCQSPEAGDYTPSDFAAANINQENLSKLLAQISQ
ncbi:acyltransferase domain-containing protein [Nostoc sp. FACHB-87]|uniref:type I polyketide synthase n=1 Tax=Nostocaceae TaxID=1162 RepID=UPI0016883BFF|nr:MULTISPECIES: type I polyketide synthase [Nostocaceae]MBD2453049.1 acyltransferase domain-containing protein [Nostoc sp. FACHB-87]MBD2475173.1 acyltransferase domain-containing protein [Anabaena sp. FACHB-83]